MASKLINPRKFHRAVNKMREFFVSKGWIEVHTQNALSILAACEDPKTITTYSYNDKIWPMPQTGQMWLENVLLDNPEIEGCFTVSTSYRNEPSPIEGRHEKIFPMFEFESKGGMDDLIKMEKELLEHLGFEKEGYVDGVRKDYPEVDYVKMMERYGVDDIEHEHEQQMWDDYGNVVMLKNFPYHTSPFWNMKKEGDIARKIDVILCGMETIGSAERSCDKVEMRDQFKTISGGDYAGILYGQFGRKRVDMEMDKFLDRDFFPRYGGGIGVTRMIHALDVLDMETKPLQYPPAHPDA